MSTKKVNYIFLTTLLIVLACLLIACKDATFEDELADKNEPVPTNCLTLRAGTVDVKLVHPDFLTPTWYVTPGSSERSNSRIELWKSANSNTDDEEVEKKIVLIVSAKYLETVEDIVKFSQIEPGLKYEESTFNGFPAAYSKMVDETEGVWDYYRIPFGNRTIEISHHPSVLTNDELAVTGKMLENMKLVEVEDDIKEAVLNECKELLKI